MVYQVLDQLKYYLWIQIDLPKFRNTSSSVFHWIKAELDLHLICSIAVWREGKVTWPWWSCSICCCGYLIQCFAPRKLKHVIGQMYERVPYLAFGGYVRFWSHTRRDPYLSYLKLIKHECLMFPGDFLLWWTLISSSL